MGIEGVEERPIDRLLRELPDGAVFREEHRHGGRRLLPEGVLRVLGDAGIADEERIVLRDADDRSTERSEGIIDLGHRHTSSLPAGRHAASA